MKDFWNEKYATEEYIYGLEPNRFLKEQLDSMQPTSILFPAEGEGRNSVYAAKLGFIVSAMDVSEVARQKALHWANQNDVRIEYLVSGMFDILFEQRQFMALAAIFTHFPDAIKMDLLRLYDSWIAPGGEIIMEVFSKNHVFYQKENPNAGGPKDPDLLFSEQPIIEVFRNYRIHILREVETELLEGDHHVGKSSVIQFRATKPLV